MKKILIIIFFIIILLGIGIGYTYYYINTSIIEVPNKVVIKKGSSVKNILKKINIKNSVIIKFYLQINGIDSKIKAGTYKFDEIYTRKTIFDILQEGRYESIKIVIPEGFTLKQIKKRLFEKGLIKKGEFDKALLEVENFPYYVENNNYEGYFFPDTYYFRKGISEKKIIKKFLDNFVEKMKFINLNSKDFYKKLILASIIEKEAFHNDEKPLIASVFYNRIKRGIKLESCATIEYLFDYKKSRLLYKDLKIESKYNTYKYNGLPPAPISNPGLNAIKAALNPAKTNYLYFVLTKKNIHHFSKTYREHLKFKNKRKEGMK